MFGLKRDEDKQEARASQADKKRLKVSKETLSAINAADTALLCSLHKSGTHWARYFFANYIRVAFSGAKEPVSYPQLQRRFGNNRLYIARGNRPWRQPSHLLRRAGLSDFLWQHWHHEVGEHLGRKIFLYRNPLDNLISLYHYSEERWRKQGREFEKPADCLFAIDRYGKWYSSMRKLASEDPSVMMVSYENLKMNPYVSFELLLRHLRIPIDQTALFTAVDFSDIKQVRKEEEERGRAIVAPTSDGVFARDGSIGQWKKHLEPKDVDAISDLLGRYKVKLSEFILE